MPHCEDTWAALEGSRQRGPQLAAGRSPNLSMAVGPPAPIQSSDDCKLGPTANPSQVPKPLMLDEGREEFCFRCFEMRNNFTKLIH